MRSAKLLTASILTVVLSVSAFASNLRFSPATELIGLNESFTLGRTNAVVSINGRVKTPDGRPIKAAYITLRDADTNQLVRSTYSSGFGYYRLEQIETGHLYVLSVSHKRYLFAFPAQLLEINEDRNGVDFTGEASDDN